MSHGLVDPNLPTFQTSGPIEPSLLYPQWPYEESDASLSSEQAFCLITDGPIPLRAVVHPEASNKGIQLVGALWQTYFDLRKEFRKCFPDLEEKIVTGIISIREMMQCMTFFY